jgi:hypothetical protein
LINQVQNPEKITKSNGSPAFSGTSHTKPRIFAIPIASFTAFTGGRPRVMMPHQPAGFEFLKCLWIIVLL